jgi:multiple sugar transport system ATP-binding protein
LAPAGGKRPEPGSSGTFLPVKGAAVMATVTFDNATCVYAGAERPSVDKLNIDVGDGEFLVLVGPSGCGKSTSLRMLAGLEDISDGAIRIGERDVTNVPSKDRDIAMVFQSYALYPHMTVAENMGFALKIAGEDKTQIRARVVEAAKILDIEPFLDRKPKALSGGQRQRVAMGRAIVRSPQVFLMDEPLSNLDAKLRVQTRSQIAALQRRLGVTTVYVTHDQVEAMTMGDRVAVLKDGLLMQVDSPRQMYDHPNNVFVAGFIGSPAMNLLEVPVVNDSLTFGQSSVPVPRDVAAQASAAGRRITVGIRPEDMELVGAGDGIATSVNMVEELGADAYIYGSADVNGDQHDIMARVDGRRPPAKGEVVHLAPSQGHLHMFSVETGQRLGN